MKIKNIVVEDYIEDVDGSIDGCVKMKDLGDGYGLYMNENGEFVIENYNEVDEFIWRVV